ncbi:MAG: hypothetical protein ABI175_14660, partial [Polyangiales bacterium]
MTPRTSRVVSPPCPPLLPILVGVLGLVACGGSVTVDPAGFDPEDTGGDTRGIDTGLRPRDSGVDSRVDTGRDTGIVRDSFVDPG